MPPKFREPVGLEAWLTGSPDELGAALAAIGAAFIVTQTSAREPLPGGRYRQYLRATTPSVPPENTDAERGHEQCEIAFPSPLSGT